MRLSTRKRPEEPVQPEDTTPVSDPAPRPDTGPPPDTVAAVLGEISELRARLPNIVGALVVGDTGDPIAADLALSAERELAAQVAVSAAVGARLASTAAVGLVREVTVHAEDGYVALYPAGHRAALAVVTTPTVNLGRLHLQARHTAARIGVVLAHAEPADEDDATA